MAISLTVNVSGINPTSQRGSAIQTYAVNFGGDDPNGILTPSNVDLKIDSSGYSPLLLKALVEQTAHTVIIKGYRPDASGKSALFVTITLGQARVVQYQIAGTEHAQVNDTVQFNFLSLNYNYAGGAGYLWQTA